MPGRLRHVPALAHAYDFKAREEYLYNHELNPERYKLPKPPPPPPDRSASAAYWAEGVTQQDRDAFAAAQHSPHPDPAVRKHKAKKAAKKTVRFAVDHGGSDEAYALAHTAYGAAPDMDLYAAGPSTAEGVGPSTAEGVGPSTAEGVGPSTAEGVGHHGGAKEFSLAAQVTRDLHGIWTDVQAFHTLPAPTAVGKVRYIMQRGSRALSMLGIVGVVLLVLCIGVACMLLFRKPAAAAKLPGAADPRLFLGGGAMPMYEDEWTRTFAPTSGPWRHATQE